MGWLCLGFIISSLRNSERALLELTAGHTAGLFLALTPFPALQRNLISGITTFTGGFNQKMEASEMKVGADVAGGV